MTFYYEIDQSYIYFKYIVLVKQLYDFWASWPKKQISIRPTQLTHLLVILLSARCQEERCYRAREGSRRLSEAGPVSWRTMLARRGGSWLEPGLGASRWSKVLGLPKMAGRLREMAEFTTDG